MSRFLQEWDSVHGGEGIFGIRLGSGTSGIFLPCLERGGGREAERYPGIPEEFLDVDYKSIGFSAGNPHPDPSFPDFPPIPFFPNRPFPIFPAFSVAPLFPIRGFLHAPLPA